MARSNRQYACWRGQAILPRTPTGYAPAAIPASDRHDQTAVAASRPPSATALGMSPIHHPSTGRNTNSLQVVSSRAGREGEPSCFSSRVSVCNRSGRWPGTADLGGSQRPIAVCWSAGRLVGWAGRPRAGLAWTQTARIGYPAGPRGLKMSVGQAVGLVTPNKSVVSLHQRCGMREWAWVWCC